MNDLQTVTQAQTDALLDSLKALRQNIKDIRDSIRPLEENLSLAWQEFEKKTGHLRRQAIVFQAEIDDYHMRLNETHMPEEITPVMEIEPAPKPEELTSSIEDPDAIHKDRLLEHIFRILDPDVNETDAELLGDLQGLCDDPSVTLAVVLEQIPWGPVWIQPNSAENLALQLARLKVWETALTERLENMNHARESLHKDPRYGLWQQQVKGEQAWNDFLERAAQQQQEQNDELKAELEELREQWTQMTET